MTRTRLAAAAVSATAAFALAAPTPAAADESPPRVTGLSNFFDYCSTGSRLAVPLLYGIGSSTVNLALAQFPAQAQPVTNQVLVAEATGPQLFDAVAPGAKQFIDAGRAGAAPLAAYNDQFNAGLSALAEGTRAGATALAPVIQPADVSARQFAAFLDSLQQK